MATQDRDASGSGNSDIDGDRAYHLAKGDGPAWWFLDTRMTIKADRAQTGGAFTLLEFAAPRGFGPPRHVHHDEDEAFFVMEGSMRVACGSEQWDALPGSSVFLPRGVPHAFVVTSPQPVAVRHANEIVGPPLDLPEDTG